jgi:hypothetical protein
MSEDLQIACSTCSRNGAGMENNVNIGTQNKLKQQTSFVVNGKISCAQTTIAP